MYLVILFTDEQLKTIWQYICFLQRTFSQCKALKSMTQLLFTLLSDSKRDELKHKTDEEWMKLLLGMGSVRLNSKLMTIQWIKATFISFTWNSLSIEFSSLILTCSVPQFNCLSSSSLFLSSVLSFPYLPNVSHWEESSSIKVLGCTPGNLLYREN